MKSEESIGIVSTGKCLPSKVLTNSDLEQIVDTSDKWIKTRTGISERKICNNSQAASDLGIEASKEALKKAGLKAEDIDIIITATLTPDRLLPSTSCYIQKALNAKNAFCFDINAACSGFLYGLVTAQHLLKNKHYKNALVIASDILTKVTDWSDRNTCVLFGDGAGAAIVGKTTQGQILASKLVSDGQFTELLYIPAGGSRKPADYDTINNREHFIRMEGNELFKIAVRSMVNAAEDVLKQTQYTTKDISLLIPHQANIRIIKAVAERLKLPMEKVFVNINRYGNMSAASTIVAFAEALEESKIKTGDLIILDAFGGGLTWGAVFIKW